MPELLTNRIRTSFFLVGFYTLSLICAVLIIRFGVEQANHPPSKSLRGMFVLASTGKRHGKYYYTWILNKNLQLLVSSVVGLQFFSGKAHATSLVHGADLPLLCGSSASVMEA
jgi:hypothetical protein